MQIINNRTRLNHKQALIDSFKNADNVIIVSPFLSNSFDFFPFEKLKHIKGLKLITTLKSKNDDQRNKVKFFRDLFDFGNRENVEITILIDNSLHGKIYISKKDDLFINAIITSANFTNNGLRVNNEWGIAIDDNDDIAKIVNELYRNVIFEPITLDKVSEFEKQIDSLPKPESKPKDDLDLSSKLSIKTNPLHINTNVNYWLKPIGVSDNIIPWDMKFDEIDSDLHFSDKNPRGVKKGDILVAYAVGHKNILSIYRVTSEVRNTGVANDRCPYYVVGENLTPFYGKDWNQYNITISNQKKEVLDDGLFDITPSGKNSYGSLMRGADKLKITKQFADCLIEKIVKINDEISTMANTRS
ncbi:MAG: phospholipase D family protein [Bacteroidales bacterium]